jgi:hypothetical protein
VCLHHRICCCPALPGLIEFKNLRMPVCCIAGGCQTLACVRPDVRAAISLQQVVGLRNAKFASCVVIVAVGKPWCSHYCTRLMVFALLYNEYSCTCATFETRLNSFVTCTKMYIQRYIVAIVILASMADRTAEFGHLCGTCDKLCNIFITSAAWCACSH